MLPELVNIRQSLLLSPAKRVVEMIKAVLLDLSGVVYQGSQLIPGADDAIAHLRKAGLELRFVTNTTRATKKSILDNLAGMGLGCDHSEIFTPAQAARQWLEQNDSAPHLLVHPDFESEFDGCKQGEPGAVIVGDAGETFSYAPLNAAFRALIKGAQFIALAENRSFKDRDGELSLDAGPFIRALEFASRRKAIVMGKPSKAFFEAALDGTGCALNESAMIGDDAEADVAGALRAGVGCGLLVRTGKFRAGDETAFEPAPTEVCDDLRAAAEWILANSQ